MPVRRLWLENCRVSAGCCLQITDHPYGLPLELSFHGLERVRFRRLPLRPSSFPNFDARAYSVVHARSDQIHDMQDGQGGVYSTTTNELWAEEQFVGNDQDSWITEQSGLRDVAVGRVHNAISPLEHLYRLANKWDDLIYAQLSGSTSPEEQRVLGERYMPSHAQRSTLAYRGSLLDPLIKRPPE